MLIALSINLVKLFLCGWELDVIKPFSQRFYQGLSYCTVLFGLISPSLHAETLNDALGEQVVHEAQKNGFSAHGWHNSLSLNGLNSPSSQMDNGLAIPSLAPQANPPFSQVYAMHASISPLTQDGVMRVVNDYFNVLLKRKLLDVAQMNVRQYRLLLSQINTHSPDYQAVSKHLILAEKSRSNAEKALQEAKKHFAMFIGKWPAHLETPPIPSNDDLPQSVGEAIEQSLKNQLILMHLNTKDKEIRVHPLSAVEPSSILTPSLKMKYRSTLALSNTVRQAWENWTKAGLRYQRANKKCLMLSKEREQAWLAFKPTKQHVPRLLKIQSAFYQAEKYEAILHTKESLARYDILSSIGQLVSYINRGSFETENTLEKERSLPINTDKLEQLLPPYANYQPLNPFLADAGHIAAVSASNNLFSFSSRYISAGQFKNKANATALIARLQSLGFMAFTQSLSDEVIVMVGPYEDQGHADIGIERLKEIAHVQGVFVLPPQYSH